MQSRRAAAFGIAAVLFVWLAQFLTVRYNYGRNWTGLFCIAPHMPVPGFLKSEDLYIFKGSEGFDGQVYHLIAHDPWARRGSADAIVGPAVFYQRLLVPALAWTLALGRDEWIHQAYYAVILAFIFLGVYWSVQLAARAGFHPAWGLAFVLTPAALTSLDRMTVDVAVAAFTAGFVLYSANGPNWRVFAILTAAALTKEQAIVLVLAYALYLVTRKRLLSAAVTIATALPMVAWFLYLGRVRQDQSHLGPPIGWVPMKGVVSALLHPAEYHMTPFRNAIGETFDYVALAGFLMALVLTARFAIQRRWTPGASASYALALSAVALDNPVLWTTVYNFGRGLTPLFLLIAIEELPGLPWLGALPMLLIDLRIAVNLVPQALGVIHGITGL